MRVEGPLILFMQFISKSEKETGVVAQKVAAMALAAHFKNAAVVALTGDLGAGKTTFAKSFARALGVRGRVLSPTFILMRKHEILSFPSFNKLRMNFGRESNTKKILNELRNWTWTPASAGVTQGTKYKNFYHVDAYRITDAEELDVLGFEKILADPQNIVLVEWADKIKEILPKDALWLEFSHGKNVEERMIRLTP